MEEELMVFKQLLLKQGQTDGSSFIKRVRNIQQETSWNIECNWSEGPES